MVKWKKINHYKRIQCSFEFFVSLVVSLLSSKLKFCESWWFFGRNRFKRSFTFRRSYPNNDLQTNRQYHMRIQASIYQVNMPNFWQHFQWKYWKYFLITTTKVIRSHDYLNIFNLSLRRTNLNSLASFSLFSRLSIWLQLVRFLPNGQEIL